MQEPVRGLGQRRCCRWWEDATRPKKPRKEKLTRGLVSLLFQSGPGCVRQGGSPMQISSCLFHPCSISLNALKSFAEGSLQDPEQTNRPGFDACTAERGVSVTARKIRSFSFFQSRSDSKTPVTQNRSQTTSLNNAEQELEIDAKLFPLGSWEAAPLGTAWWCPH